MEIISLVANTGGTLGLAVFAIWMLNRTWEVRLAEAKKYAAELEQLHGETLDALQNNTAAMTRLCERME